MHEKDSSTYEGCMELVEKIRRFWERQGYFPAVIAVCDYSSASDTAGLRKSYRIESNMTGGWPRGKAQITQANTQG